jgi:hypothetical protein
MDVAGSILSSLLGDRASASCSCRPNISAARAALRDRRYAVRARRPRDRGAFWLPLDGGDTALIVLTGSVSILFGS